MKVSRRTALVASLGALPAAGILEALGQQARPDTAAVMDALLAPWILADGYRQIQVSQLAQKTSTDRRVKEFALAEINEHKELKTRLVRMGFRPVEAPAAPDTLPPRRTEPSGTGTPGAPPAARSAAPDTAFPGATPPGAVPGTTPPRARQPVSPPPDAPPDRTPPPTTRRPEPRDLPRPGAPASPILRLGSLKQELAEQCVATLSRELSKKEGAAFDLAYITDQLSAHYELLDTVVVFQRHAGAELRRSLANDAQPIIEKHIAVLHRIMRAMTGA